MSLNATGSHRVRASGARSAAGRPANRTNGFARAAMSGTPSTPEESALPVFISGLRPSASRAADGRLTQSGMHIDSGYRDYELVRRQSAVGESERS